MEVLLGFFAIALYLTPLILAIINFSRTSGLMKRVQHLERMTVAQSSVIEELRGRTSPRTPEPPTVAEEKVQAKPVAPLTPPPQSTEPIVSAQSQAPKEKASAEFVPVGANKEVIREGLFATVEPASLRQAGYSKPKGRSNREWEALIGGKVLNRIGALALIIGMGFFLKYAFDNNWISETLRVLIGAAAGVGLLYGGYRSHQKELKIFAQGLVGAGIAILYLSVYAAFNFYHLIPQVVAFGLMSCVTALTLLQAWKYDSLAVAMLGWAGGFLTPFMLSTGSANQIGLFTYIALLDAGLLAIVLSKEKWFVLEPLSLAATAFIYLLWFDSSYKPDALTPTIFFATIFWGLFFAVEAVRSLRDATPMVELRQVVGLANAILFFTALYNILEPDYHWWMGVTTVLIGVPYFAMFALLKPNSEPKSLSLNRNLLTAIALLFTATAIHFYGMTTAMLWSIEALVIVFAGTRWNMKSAWTAAMVMFIFSFVKLALSEGFWGYVPLEEFRMLLNIRVLNFVVIAAAMFASAELFRRNAETMAEVFGSILTYMACIVVFVLISAETADLFDRWLLYVEADTHRYLAFKRDLTLAIVWMCYSIVLAYVGFKREANPFLVSSLAVFGFSLLIGLFRCSQFDPISYHQIALNYRVLTLAVLALGAVVQLRIWKTSGTKKKWNGVIVKAIGFSIVVMVFVLLTSEVVDFFEQRIVSLQAGISADSTVEDSLRIQSYENLQQLWLSGVWLLYSIVMLVAGIWRRFRALRLVAIGLFMITIVKIFVFDLSFLETLYRIISFMGLGVILLSVSYLYQKFKSIILEGE